MTTMLMRDPSLEAAYKMRLPVEVYRNLNAAKTGKPEWSIRTAYRCEETGKKKKKVIGYLDNLQLDNVTAKASAKGAARIRSKGQREVVAWMIGTLAYPHDCPHLISEADLAGKYRTPFNRGSERVSYNPHRGDTFTDESGAEFESAPHAVFSPKGRMVAFG